MTGYVSACGHRQRSKSNYDWKMLRAALICGLVYQGKHSYETS
jgi:hypothetical protein